MVRSFLVSGIVLSMLASACASSSKHSLNRDEKARLFVEVANGALLENDSASALANLLEAEKLSPDLPELHHSRAIAYFLRNDFDSAKKSVRHALDLKSDYADANNTLGKLLLDQGRFDEALPYLKKAANDPLYPDAFKAYTSMGILFYKKHEYALADKQFDLAIKQGRDLACVAQYYRGMILVDEKRSDKAIRSFEKASQKSCGGFVEAHFALARAYENSKQYDRARKKFLDVQMLYPDHKLADEAIKRLRTLP